MISDEDFDSRNCSLDRKNLYSIVKVFASHENVQNYESLVPFNTQGAIKPRQLFADILILLFRLLVKFGGLT